MSIKAVEEERKKAEIKKWVALVQDTGSENRTGKGKNGTLTMIGSGIQAVGHFTLEALGYIKSCDKLFYCVADPVTENYIKSLRPDAMNLCILYDDDKERYKTYVQMSEVMLHEARKRLHVVGIFYGHPGVFVYPSHRAMKIAKNEGIKTKMLPAPSAEDCLFADLGIDPSYPGCQMFEATDLLIRNRQILPDLHVIIWQVGCVGNFGFNYSGFGSTQKNLDVLISKLLQIYGQKYKLVHYIGSQYSLCEPVKDEIPLAAFSEKKVRDKITGFSTFYLPPKTVKDIDYSMAKKLGIQIGKSTKSQQLQAAVDLDHVELYNEKANAAIADLKSWSFPQRFRVSIPSEMSDYITRHSLDPKAIPDTSKLSEDERKAIEEKDFANVSSLLRDGVTGFTLTVALAITVVVVASV